MSAIAYEITGTKWNGYLFFGLTKEKMNIDAAAFVDTPFEKGDPV